MSALRYQAATNSYYIQDDADNDKILAYLDRMLGGKTKPFPFRIADQGHGRKLVDVQISSANDLAEFRDGWKEGA